MVEFFFLQFAVQVQVQSIGLLSSPLKVLPSSALLRMPYERWAMLPFIPPWLNHTWVRLFYRRITHEYFSVRPYPAWHVDCISLQSAWIEPSSAAVTEFTLILLRVSPYWLHLLSTNYSNIWNSN